MPILARPFEPDPTHPISRVRPTNSRPVMTFWVHLCSRWGWIRVKKRVLRPEPPQPFQVQKRHRFWTCFYFPSELSDHRASPSSDLMVAASRLDDITLGDVLSRASTSLQPPTAAQVAEATAQATLRQAFHGTRTTDEASLVCGLSAKVRARPELRPFTEDLSVNRKEMGYAVAGMLGTMVGAGCANPERSSAGLPTMASKEITPATAQPPVLRVHTLLMEKGRNNAFFAQAGVIVSSSNPTSCRIRESRPFYVYLEADNFGASEITVRDSATGLETTFKVHVI
jgi:hypothetical protein